MNCVYGAPFRRYYRQAVLAALALYGATPRLDFGDALIIASMQASGSTTVYSYDAQFDKIPDIRRQQP